MAEHEPQQKRAKLAEAAPEAASTREHLLLPYRAVGSVTGPVPPAVVTAGKDSFALCAVGRSLHEYNLAKLQLIHVSPALPKKIRAVAKEGTLNIAAAGGVLYCFKVRRLIWTATHSKHAKVKQLIARNDVLLSLASDSTVKVWNLSSGELLNECTFRHDATPSLMATVWNYKNKVVVGTVQGHLELWNFNTGSLVHKFDSLGAGVTALATAPADDTVAVGLADGSVLLYNLAFGKVLFKFQHVRLGGRAPAVTAISFRMDGPHVMTSATELGEIAVWNLDKKKLEGLLTSTVQAAAQDEVFETPHQGRVSLLHFLPMEPVLFTAGEDNALKMFVFDKLAGTGKLLRERRGHYEPCNGVQFFDSRLVLSYSQDRTLRISHVFSDLFNREMSQGALVKEARKRGVQTLDLRLPAITCLASSTKRTHDWGALVTGHRGSATARVWRMDNFAIMTKKSKNKDGVTPAATLTSPDPRDAAAEVSAVQISRCGNFALLGLSNGRLHCFNLQSGNYQGAYMDDTVEGDKAHSGRIFNIFLMQDNSLAVTVGADCYIRLWSFPPRPYSEAGEDDLLAFRMAMPTVPTMAAFNSANCFLAVAKPDYSIDIYDVSPLNLDTGMTEIVAANVRRIKKTCRAVPAKLVRAFPSRHGNALTALAFTPDSRLLFAASLDASMAVWDIPTDRLVDLVKFPSAVTGLSVHPDSYFVATTHAGGEQLYLWTNKVKYGHVPTAVRGDGSALAVADLFKLPEVTTDGTFEDDVEEKDEKEVKIYDPENPEINLTPEQTEAEKALIAMAEGDVPGCIGLSQAARNKWMTIVALDAIKKRNKPIAPPKKVDAPFFIPSAEPQPGSLQAKEKEEQDKKQGASKIMNSLKTEGVADVAAANNTPFLHLLEKADFDGALALLEEMGASKVDLEFRSLIDTNYEAFLAASGGLKRKFSLTDAQDPDAEGDDDDDAPDALSLEVQRRSSLLLSFFEHHLARRTQFEYVQAVLNVFLRHCGLAAVRDPDVKARLARVAMLQNEDAALLSSLVDNSLALIRNFIAPA
eukprot:TRINITY_DN21006_c0_g1_i1.p1 TRINITY_DN21006_c0_g1~~TRINITY_DN21006_c0_g1_i1.p1  ORF type:complete len:1087 (+),score=486.80 TRINITY_DN21006_c0_g1_i1:142-3261(+)